MGREWLYVFRETGGAFMAGRARGVNAGARVASREVRTGGANLPARDLFVSPGHAICVDACGEVLIAAGALVDGVTIEQIEVETVTYWHVELGAARRKSAAESYLERGNHAFFSNADIVALAAMPEASPRTQADFCRPFLAPGALVDAVRARLTAFAGAMRSTKARIAA